VDSKYPLENIFNSDERFEVRSDADDQLIIHFSFTEQVKLSGFSLAAPTNDLMPTKIRLFTNQVSMDFSDASDLPAAFEMDVDAADLAEDKIIPLKRVKFIGIHSLTLFVESSEGGDNASVTNVKFFGEPMQGTNMNELKKVGAE
ncbi:Thioredoxin-like protein 1 (Thioredoxin-related protein), partial [Durusdinium trenchii]